MDSPAQELELSVVMPCLDEAETLETCIRKAKDSINEHNLAAEIIVADNGSRDGSQQSAEANGAKVINVNARGYGAALAGGINAARGRYIVMGDADDSYDFRGIFHFVEKLREDYDLVMGCRESQEGHTSSHADNTRSADNLFQLLQEHTWTAPPMKNNPA